MRALSIGAFAFCFCVLAGIATQIERSPARQAADAALPQRSFRPVAGNAELFFNSAAFAHAVQTSRRVSENRNSALPSPAKPFAPNVPKMWNDAAMATLEVPLADPIGSPIADPVVATPAQAPEKTSPAQAEAREALARFTRAFDNLDWDGFRSAFDDSATVFFPSRFAERADGRTEFEENFSVFFQRIRVGSRKSTAPYMDLQPKGLRIQLFNDVAVATFHLYGQPGFLGRRTIVLHKTKAGWKIVHIHASEMADPGAHR